MCDIYAENRTTKWQLQDSHFGIIVNNNDVSKAKTHVKGLVSSISQYKLQIYLV